MVDKLTNNPNGFGRLIEKNNNWFEDGLFKNGN